MEYAEVALDELQLHLQKVSSAWIPEARISGVALLYSIKSAHIKRCEYYPMIGKLPVREYELVGHSKSSDSTSLNL